MAEEMEEEAGSERSNTAVQVAEGGSETEIFPTRSIRKRRVDGRAVLRDVSEEALYANLGKVISLITDSINEKNSVPHAKFLVELVSQLRVNADVSVETYESVAAVIWKSYRKVQETEVQGTEEQGIGSREQGTEGRVLPLVVDV